MAAEIRVQMYTHDGGYIGLHALRLQNVSKKTVLFFKEVITDCTFTR
jgi:hypothetical protein